MPPPVKSRPARFGFDARLRITGAVDGATRELPPPASAIGRIRRRGSLPHREIGTARTDNAGLRARWRTCLARIGPYLPENVRAGRGSFRYDRPVAPSGSELAHEYFDR
jgi:hypothetical protein